MYMHIYIVCAYAYCLFKLIYCMLINTHCILCVSAILNNWSWLKNSNLKIICPPPPRKHGIWDYYIRVCLPVILSICLSTLVYIISMYALHHSRDCIYFIYKARPKCGAVHWIFIFFNEISSTLWKKCCCHA